MPTIAYRHPRHSQSFMYSSDRFPQSPLLGLYQLTSLNTKGVWHQQVERIFLYNWRVTLWLLHTADQNLHWLWRSYLFPSREISTVWGVHPSWTTKLILICNLFHHQLHWVFSFVVVLSLFAVRQGHNDKRCLFSVTTFLVEGLRMWFVMERCKRVTHIQRNWIFFKKSSVYVCLWNWCLTWHLHWSVQDVTICLEFSTKSPHDALSWHCYIQSDPYNNPPPAGCISPWLLQDMGIVAKDSSPDGKFQERSWKHKPYHVEETEGARRETVANRGTEPGSEKTPVHIGSVMSPWHQGKGGPFGATAGGLESRLWGVSQLLLLWLYVLHGEGEELGW